MSDYPPGGALFLQANKRSPKAPDYSGNLELSKEVFKYLLDEAKAGRPIKMDLAGWRKQTKAGSTFLSIVANKPYVKEQKTADIDDEIPF